MDQELIKNDRHNCCIRSSGDEPFQPADILAENLLDESDSNHVLCCCCLDADIPQAVCLSDGHHQYSCKRGSLFKAECADDAYNNRNHAGNSGRCGRYEETQNETNENDADDKTAGLDADMGHNDKSDTLVKTRDHHAR